jgi:hypothetical protein
MVICERALLTLSDAVLDRGRPDHEVRGIARAVAMEHMRVARVRFANPTAFAGMRYRSRVRLVIVPK